MTTSHKDEGPIQQDAEYHDAHLNDPEEWEQEERVATVRPSGMTVFSLRMPTAELNAVREAAARAHMPIADIMRAALRAYLGPGTAHIAVSASAEAGTVATTAPLWLGGQVQGSSEYVEERRSTVA